MQDSEKHLLIVEDDEGLQRQLRWCFDGYEVAVAGDRKDAIARVRRHQPGVVLLDLGLPPDPGGVTEGLATLQEIQALSPETKVIIVTGDNERANAVRAIALGAYDFYQKPVEPEVLRTDGRPCLPAPRARAREPSPAAGTRQRADERHHRHQPADAEGLPHHREGGTVGHHRALLGASGFGKERVALALHYEHGPRRASAWWPSTTPRFPRT